MTAKHPPRLATHILESLGPQNDALVGDLAEEYQAGRSALWYWWQVLTSIIIGAGRELWMHKWLGVHAVATLLGLRVLLAYVWKVLWYETTLSARVQEFTVSVWGQPDPVVNAPYRWIFLLASFPVTILAGWILAKVHRGQRGAAVIISCLAATALALPRLVTLLKHQPSSINLYLYVGGTALALAGLLLGALITERAPKSSQAT